MTRQEIQARLDQIEREAAEIINSLPYRRGGSPEQEARLGELHDEHTRLWKEYRGTAPEPEPELVEIPTAFFFDHEARDLPTPAVVRETKRNVWIRRDAPELPELVSDARYYADPTGFDPEVQRTLCRSARALLAALERAGVA